MRVGMFLSDTGGRRSSLDEIGQTARWCETAGLASGWVPYLPWSVDPFVALTVAGAATSALELGTAVVPTYPFHPMAMARLAMSVTAANGGRLSLGIGPSHQSVIEGMYGYRYDRPARHTEEYVVALRSAFEGGDKAGVQGEFFTFSSMFTVPGGKPPALLIAALAPRMLTLAGRYTDGTVLWFAAEHALEAHVVPRLRAAASEAGRPHPRIVAAMPTAVCDEDEGRSAAAKAFAAYDRIPTYRRILDRGEAGGPADVVLVGSRQQITDRLRRWRDLGVTDVVAAPFPVGDDRAASLARTRDTLAAIAATLEER